MANAHRLFRWAGTPVRGRIATCSSGDAFPSFSGTTEDYLGTAEQLGMKLTCESCGARFYDLNKTPGICPKCGTANSRPAVFKTRGRPAPEEKRAPVVVAKPVPDEEEGALPEADDDDEEEAVIEDTSDLGEDDDVEVVVEKDSES